MKIRKNWWKYLGIVLVLYSIVAGFWVEIPDSPIRQSMRNIFFHVPMWFAMMALFTVSMVNSIRFLLNFNSHFDEIAHHAAIVGLLFGLMGILTGMEWAYFTWGIPWLNDPQLNGSAVTLLAYSAYFVLRRSIDQPSKQARVAAVYNIFAFAMMIVFLGIIPRINTSIHPSTSGETSAIGSLTHAMRYVFFPAILGWILLAVWLLKQRMHLQKLKNKVQDL